MQVLAPNQLVEKYPYSIGKLRKDNPNVSFPKRPDDDLLADWGVYTVQPTPKPDYNRATEKVVEGTPINQNGVWVQTWEVLPLTSDEIADLLKKVQDDVVSNAQQRLDNFARTRNYYGMMSLCTYASSSNPKFQKEGQYGVEIRDATWAKCYEILAEVEAGTRPAVTGYAEIEPELPVFKWPE